MPWGSGWSGSGDSSRRSSSQGSAGRSRACGSRGAVRRPSSPSDRGRATPVDLTRERRSAVLGIAAILSVAIFLLYLGRYPLRHANVPAGFDAPWYVWRAQYVGAKGIGALGTSSRPGHAVLSALLGSVTGLSQLRM